MKRVLAIAALGLLTLSGCAATPTPYEVAWAACLEMNGELYPDGLENAEDGELYDAERLCHSTEAAQGKDEFITLFTDPEWIKMYSDKIKEIGG